MLRVRGRRVGSLAAPAVSWSSATHACPLWAPHPSGRRLLHAELPHSHFYHVFLHPFAEHPSLRDCLPLI